MSEVIARVAGEELKSLPTDLYIPPDAMRVMLDIFEGPLDFLLYLIRKQNLQILDIPISRITTQYVAYVDLMQELHFELAAEYLEMAAILAEIKSRMLLPQIVEEDEEVDPRAELVRRLQEYEQIKVAAENLDKLPRQEREIFVLSAKLPDIYKEKPEPHVDIEELIVAFRDILKRADLNVAHNIELETLTVRERMSIILNRLEDDKFVDFSSFFDFKEGRIGIIVTFLAVLEMVKEKVLELIQSEPYAPIYVRTSYVAA